MLDDCDVELTQARLRERAEATVQTRVSPSAVAPPTNGGCGASGELERLLFELEVHKVELELQNEALRDAEERVVQQRDRYRELYELAPVAYLLLDSGTTVREANLAAARLLGVPRGQLVGLPLASFLDQAGADELHRHLQRVLTTNEKARCELVLHGVGPQHEVRALLESVAVQMSGSALPCCRTVLIETSDQVSAGTAADVGSRPSGSGVSVAGAAHAASSERTRSILLVEKDANARSALLELLRGEGYTVLSSATPSEALALSQYAERIDVLLADLRLPEMSGEQLADKLRALHPCLNVILMSGLPSPTGNPKVRFIQKPIELDALIDLIG
jgi:PAS domain S-box-containing protein